MNELNIVLNGKNIKGQANETIHDLAKRHGIEIPTLCHDPRLEPYTSCYVCVVEVEGMRGLQPSCSTRLNEGMKISTDNDRIRKSRKTALDLLLSNHYADCVAPCKETCPAGVDVQGYISLIEKGMYHEAVGLIKETNPLPAICGRVCVRPCEVACRRNLLDEGHAVGIDYLKRYAADRDLESLEKWRPHVKPDTGKKVCVIGAGPGGLSAAFFLRKSGHAVDIYEAAPSPGGWLRYGIPEYRLPNNLLQKEVDNIAEMGVNIFYNKRLGDNVKYADLNTQYDACILAIGSQKGTLTGSEGDDAVNVFSGVDFLKEMEMNGKPFDFSGKKVAVVGGGNTAMDCCRSSIRCGAEKVYIIYRRTENEMPANPIEIHESKLEGVEYLLLTNPSRINKDEEGKVKSVTCIRMELGEPDASGRRRPVPVEGSDFDIEIDIVLAAIGQKTSIDFLEEINGAVSNGELKATRWGDIDADKNTLQTGIANVFAAGDAVTGPATLIQAVGQARIAARSCHQYLSGQPLAALAFEFISRKDHFKVQEIPDYKGHYGTQERQEMPTLDPNDRYNFHEVELGYENEEVAYNETQRCLECGCTEYYGCDLKKYGTEYKAEQKRLGGEFKEYAVDFRHPYIEIDSNKCILCSRCVRICKEVVGANALGLVNRGFDTYVAPAMGDALQDTYCESCGMCVSTCPTGAITENFFFKPGPVKLEAVETICNFCSIGCSIELNHKKEYVMKVTGAEGRVNKLKSLCRYPKFGYKYLNDNSRITHPLLKVNSEFQKISFEKAFDIISEKISAATAKENAFFAGARLSNEELYLIQKLARLGAKTNYVGSFHYLGRGRYAGNTKDNVPFEQVRGASRLYLLGSEIHKDNAIAGMLVHNHHYMSGTPVELITSHPDTLLQYKVNETLVVKDYYAFIKAVNHYLLSNTLQNQLFINDNCIGFDLYKQDLLKEDYAGLCQKAGVDQALVEGFALRYNEEMNAILFYSEKELGSNACKEIYNLAMITGKLGKTSNGIVTLKEKNNSQGLEDMGLDSRYGVGYQDLNDPQFMARLKESWKVDELPAELGSCRYELTKDGKAKNFFIFGEDPIGCAIDVATVKSWFANAAFVMVQDYFMSETAKMADLILPASFPAETGGSFTNTQKMIQEFDAGMALKIEHDNISQLLSLLRKFGSNGLHDVNEVRSEIFGLLPLDAEKKHQFVYTEKDNANRMFSHGCDVVNKIFDDEFEAAF